MSELDGTASRHHGLANASDEAESVPLFSADEEAYETNDTSLKDTSRHQPDSVKGLAADEASNHHSRIPSPSYPPPKYLKSTYTSREHEFDASDDFIDDPGSDPPQDVPVLTGLLQSARNRGSIDVHRRSSSSGRNDGSGADDSTLDNGLVVGLGQGGGILASVS